MNIGITGHQELANPLAWQWVTTQIQQQIEAAEPPLHGYTSLAKGADQIFADLVIAAGGRLHVVIPFENYARTLNGQYLTHYYKLLKNASSETLHRGGSDEDAFFAAGRRVVDLAQRVLAVWDGKPARGKGGTADVVAYSQSKHIPVVHINPIDRTVRTLT